MLPSRPRERCGTRPGPRMHRPRPGSPREEGTKALCDSPRRREAPGERTPRQPVQLPGIGDVRPEPRGDSCGPLGRGALPSPGTALAAPGGAAPASPLGVCSLRSPSCAPAGAALGWELPDHPDQPGPSTRVSCCKVHGSRQTAPHLSFSAATYT